MRRYYITVAAALLLSGCPKTNGVVPDEPPPSPNPDVVADCAKACDNIGPRTKEHPDALGCEEGKPTADGATCTDVCNSMPNTTQDYLSCVATVTACSQIQKCPH